MLNRVTFTGVDDKTNIEDLVYLTNKYPFVEFGILVSKNGSNSGEINRYPNLTILKRLKKKDLNLSCHICGSIARQIVQKNDWSGLEKLLGKDIEVFNCFQLNVSGIHKFSKEITFREDKEFIIQLKNDLSLYDYYKDLPNVFGFQDNSGGVGKFEDNWMESDRYFGYAGGLSVENIEKVIEDLLIINEDNFWIDMETSVRTDDWFDTKKCEEILKICEKFFV